MTKHLKKASPVEFVAKLIESVLALALIVAVALNFGNVIGRYLFGVAFVAADEIQIYLMAAAAFIGAATVTLHHMHLRMDVLLSKFPPEIRFALKIVELMLIVGLCGLVAYESFKYVTQLYIIQAVSENAHIPMWIPQASVTIGFSLMTVAGALQLVQAVRERSIEFLNEWDIDYSAEDDAIGSPDDGLMNRSGTHSPAL
jgi:TRAP-type C4-dicarboxylate transport system permease small subunit